MLVLSICMLEQGEFCCPLLVGGRHHMNLLDPLYSPTFHFPFFGNVETYPLPTMDLQASFCKPAWK